MSGSGSLVCVGAGMTLGSHLTPLARSYIETSEVVFAGLSDGFVEEWLRRMRPDLRSFQPLYINETSRKDTYQKMVDLMLAEVRSGHRVCGVFYGHPGVFVWAPHRAIEIARQEGYRAHMEPGVSSEDCLYAELGIDPGRYGCQHYEAGQLMFYRRRIDPSAYLIVWQLGAIGEQSIRRITPADLQALVDVLTRDYDPSHEVIVYEAATLPLHRSKIQRFPLRGLPNSDIDPHSTLVIPPARELEPDPEIRQRLTELDRATCVTSPSQ